MNIYRLTDGDHDFDEFIVADETTEEEIKDIVQKAREIFYSDDCSVSLYEIIKDMLPEDCYFTIVTDIDW